MAGLPYMAEMEVTGNLPTISIKHGAPCVIRKMKCDKPTSMLMWHRMCAESLDSCKTILLYSISTDFNVFYFNKLANIHAG